MKDVFISYKTEEFDEANLVRTVLETNGISCWMAPMSIPGGSSYAKEIPQAIRECKIFVLILSEKSQNSKWVPRELDQAINEGKTVLPFMLENCPLTDDFNFYLTNVQRYAAYESKNAALEKMLREIKAILGIDDIPSSEGASETVKSEENARERNSVTEQKEASEKKEETAPNQTKEIKKPKKTKEKKEQASKEKKKPTKAIAVIAAVFAAVILVAVIINVSTHVTIADEKFSKSDDMLYFNNVNFTQKDYEAFDKIKNIEALSFTDCEIEESELIELANRTGYSLTLNNCGITNELLSKIDFENSKIRSLDLSNNKALSDIAPIKAIASELDTLVLDNCSVEMLDCLADASQLHNISCEGNKIRDILPLSKAIKLSEINLSSNEITSLASFKNLKDITALKVRNNKLTSLQGIENNIRLDTLDAGENQLSDIVALSNATQLKDVKLDGNKLTDIGILAKSKDSLEKLNISNNPDIILNGIKDCIKLTSLYADNTGLALSEISAISNMVNLTTVSAANNSISNVDAFEKMEKLTYIDLSNNKINSTDKFNFMADINFLDLSNNSITELKLPVVKYYELRIYGNNIADITAIGTLGERVAFDYNASIDFSFLNKTSYYGIYLMNCPLDKQVSIENTVNKTVKFTDEEAFLKEVEGE